MAEPTIVDDAGTQAAIARAVEAAKLKERPDGPPLTILPPDGSDFISGPGTTRTPAPELVQPVTGRVTPAPFRSVIPPEGDFVSGREDTTGTTRSEPVATRSTTRGSTPPTPSAGAAGAAPALAGGGLAQPVTGPGAHDLHAGPHGTVGSTGKEVRNAQLMLEAAGLGAELGATGVDGKFGPKTEAAVKKFQHSHGLPETGAIDEATNKSLTTEFQKAHNKAFPDNKIPENGIIDPATEKALELKAAAHRHGQQARGYASGRHVDEQPGGSFTPPAPTPSDREAVQPVSR